MSRTKKGAKGPGYDYWSKRAGNHPCVGHGKDVKKHTHRLERIEGVKQTKEAQP